MFQIPTSIELVYFGEYYLENFDCYAMLAMSRIVFAFGIKLLESNPIFKNGQIIIKRDSWIIRKKYS